MNIQSLVRELASKAKAASRILATASTAQRNAALTILADLLRGSADEIFAANTQDIERAQTAGLDAARIDRLRITTAVLESMAVACTHVASLPDPVGEVDSMVRRPNGLWVGRMRIPLGVIAIIYE
ncbi:MAG: gamma-glutamyl-phosphate reductase, partial [Desulfovibrionales bacterium]|nr:gamma-glutamyl-phosphate reductase [Desulfovibrionales bacterium]